MVRWHAVWPKKAHFLPYFADFFDRSAATACKNLLCLAKNGHFFASDARAPISYYFFAVFSAFRSLSQIIRSFFNFLICSFLSLISASRWVMVTFRSVLSEVS